MNSASWTLVLEHQHKSFFPAQHLYQKLEKGVQNITFIQISDCFNVDCVGSKSHGQPGSNRIERNHPQDSNHIFLHLWHVPVGQVQIHQSERQDNGPQHHDAGRSKGCRIQSSIAQSMISNNWHDKQHDQQGRVGQVVAGASHHFARPNSRFRGQKGSTRGSFPHTTTTTPQWWHGCGDDYSWFICWRLKQQSVPARPRAPIVQ
mmetsp:Transcript_19500/g.53672  ORF Transcript_19500/g.53672 Transcript_19500/m.53672 type:complete len:204 (-) Transcript_19500:460-1071(-)